MRRRDLRQLQVFLDRQSLDDAPVFRHQADTVARRLVRFHLVQRLVIEPDFAVAKLGIVDPRHRAQRRRLAGAVAPQQGDDFALADVETDALNDVALAVVCVQVPYRAVSALTAHRLDRLNRRRPLAAEGLVAEQFVGVILVDCLIHRCAPPR